MVLGEKHGQFWASLDEFRGHMQWKKCGSREGIWKAKAKWLQNCVLYSYNVQFIVYLFLPCLSRSCIPLNQMESKNTLNQPKVGLSTLCPNSCHLLLVSCIDLTPLFCSLCTDVESKVASAVCKNRIDLKHRLDLKPWHSEMEKKMLFMWTWNQNKPIYWH